MFMICEGVAAAPTGSKVNGFYRWGLGGPRRHLLGPSSLRMGKGSKLLEQRRALVKQSRDTVIVRWRALMCENRQASGERGLRPSDPFRFVRDENEVDHSSSNIHVGVPRKRS